MKKGLFLPLCVLLLASCTSQTGSITSQDNKTSNQDSSSEVTTKGESETSKDATTNSSETTATDWSSTEKELMHTYLEGMEVPFIPISGAYWSYDENYGTLSYMKDNGSLQDCKHFTAELKKLDNAVDVFGDEQSKDTVDDYYHEFEITVEELKSIRLSIYMLDENTFNVDAYPFLMTKAYEAPTELIKELFNCDVNIPAPTFTCSKYYSGFYASILDYVVELYFYTDTDHSQDYANTLLEAGFEAEAIDEEYTIYIDSTGVFALDVSYNPNLKAVNVNGMYVGE